MNWKRLRLSAVLAAAFVVGLSVLLAILPATRSDSAVIELPRVSPSVDEMAVGALSLLVTFLIVMFVTYFLLWVKSPKESA